MSLWHQSFSFWHFHGISCCPNIRLVNSNLHDFSFVHSDITIKSDFDALGLLSLAKYCKYSTFIKYVTARQKEMIIKYICLANFFPVWPKWLLIKPKMSRVQRHISAAVGKGHERKEWIFLASSLLPSPWLFPLSTANMTQCHASVNTFGSKSTAASHRRKKGVRK